MDTERLVTAERDLFCAICGALVDHHVVNVRYRDNGLSTAMLMSDSMRVHRADTGPWSDEEVGHA